jgi:eukaryotic-like serine/threonine-protein kinase
MKHFSRMSLVVMNAVVGAGLTTGLESRSAEEVQAPARAPAVESPPVTLFRGGPRRTGSISGRIAIENPKVLSIIPTDGDPGEALLADGVIYVGGRRETIYAINIADGKILWKAAGVGFVYGSPARRGDTIYVASPNGLTALARADGKRLWNCALTGSATESSPLIVNDRIIVGDNGGSITAVSFDGKVIWRYDVVDDKGGEQDSAALNGLDRARPRTAACDGPIVYQPIFDQKRIIAIDLKAGRRRWAFETKGWVYGVPAVSDDNVYFGSQDKNLYCLNKTRKTLLWTFPTTSRIEAGVAYQNGSVFCASCDGSVYRVNADTGKEIWTYRTPKSAASPAIYSAPVCTEDAVYFGSFDGYLYCLNIDVGKLEWRFRPVEGSQITGTPQTDGRRIALAIRKARDNGRGEDGIVIVEEGPNEQTK